MNHTTVELAAVGNHDVKGGVTRTAATRLYGLDNLIACAVMSMTAVIGSLLLLTHLQPPVQTHSACR